MNSIIPYGNYLRVLDELPKHISHDQYMKLRELPRTHYEEKKLLNNRNEYLIIRDTLFIDFTWETGGRIGDITRIRQQHIDFDNYVLTLDIKKSKKIIKINLSKELCYMLSQFYRKYPGKEPFDMTTANAWLIVKKYGKLIGIDLHPHMFRHGLALFLLGSNVPIPIISYRLGHSDTRTTMSFYMRITPEIEKKFMQDINFR